MSLPSIFDYLPDGVDEILKLAEVKRDPYPSLTPEVAKAGLKAIGLVTLGGGLGYGAGKVLGPVLEKLYTRATGQPISLNHLSAAGALLGGTLVAAEGFQNKKFQEVLQRAHQDSQKQPSRRLR